MKSIIKLTLALMLGIFAFGFQSCGSDDKDEPVSKNYATSSEIQGKWSGTLNGMYYTFTFSGDNYTYGQMRISDSEIVKRSSGTYSIKDHEISFEGGKDAVPWSDYEIYWSDNTKQYLQIGDLLKLIHMSN